jgi:hypothetical protein
VTNYGSAFGDADTVAVYSPGSDGDVAPIEVIGGLYTGLSGPQGIVVDPAPRKPKHRRHKHHHHKPNRRLRRKHKEKE